MLNVKLHFVGIKNALRNLDLVTETTLEMFKRYFCINCKHNLDSQIFSNFEIGRNAAMFPHLNC